MPAGLAHEDEHLAALLHGVKTPRPKAPAEAVPEPGQVGLPLEEVVMPAVETTRWTTLLAPVALDAENGGPETGLKRRERSWADPLLPCPHQRNQRRTVPDADEQAHKVVTFLEYMGGAGGWKEAAVLDVLQLHGWDVQQAQPRHNHTTRKPRRGEPDPPWASRHTLTLVL